MTLTNPIKLHKFTTRYCDLQDRLCLDGESESGDTVSLWFTHRLMKNLLTTLIKYITPASDDKNNSATLAQWELAHARAVQQLETPVEVPTDHAENNTSNPPTGWLISSIDINSSPHQVILTYNTINTKVAFIELSADHLRQWVSIIYTVWQSTGWSLEVFPVWMKSTETPALATNVVLH